MATQVFYFARHHAWLMWLVFNIILNHCNHIKAILRNCFNHLASIKLDKSNQLTSSVTFPIRHIHPTHQLSLPCFCQFLPCSLWLGFAVSKVFTGIFFFPTLSCFMACNLISNPVSTQDGAKISNLLRKVSSDFACLLKVSRNFLSWNVSLKISR